MTNPCRFGITVDRLKEAIHYDPDTGAFTRLHNSARARKGLPAGVSKSGRYAQIMIDKVQYRAHRLAFLYMMGRWPSPEVDHIDLERSNNKWNNLREANRSQNIFNTSKRSTNSSGLKGVSWAKDRRAWRAQIREKDKVKMLGSFATKEEAHAAYCEAAKSLCGEFHRAI